MEGEAKMVICDSRQTDVTVGRVSMTHVRAQFLFSLSGILGLCSLLRLGRCSSSLCR